MNRPEPLPPTPDESASARRARKRAPVRLSLLVRASIALHASALGVVVIAPTTWLWCVGAVLLNHFILVAQGLWPRSQLLGYNCTRLPQQDGAPPRIALTIDDGPDPEVTPQILEMLEKAGVRATFFCIGERARRYPELMREIVRFGHAVENHSENHSPLFSFFGIGRLYREVLAAQTSLTALAQRPPRFFRAPAGLRSPLLDPVLQRLGLRLVSWTRRGYDTRERRPDVVAARLMRGLTDRDILLVHDGNVARDIHGVPVVFEALPLLLAAARLKGYRWVLLRDAL